MWLLDANISRKVKKILADAGISCATAQEKGWQKLINGQLVAKAVEDGFTVLLTQDTLFLESASRTLKKHPEFSVVLIRLMQQPGKKYFDAFQDAFQKSKIVPIPGQLLEWP